VIADVDVEGLGDYFVGERTRVYVNTGARRAIVIPRSYVFRRAGVNYVKSADGVEVVVQPGAERDDGVEILSGLSDGDVLVAP
jgi:multidrug efflux pump subunit AcrA (membrane-fusion protein)